MAAVLMGNDFQAFVEVGHAAHPNDSRVRWHLPVQLSLCQTMHQIELPRRTTYPRLPLTVNGDLYLH